MTIHKNLQGLAQTQPAKISLAYGEDTLTYQELAELTQDLALRLSRLFAQGTKIMIKHHHPLTQLSYFLAGAQAGLIMIITDSKLTEEQASKLADRITAQAVLDEEFILPREKSLSLPPVNQADLFLGALSSGTTGEPKLILRSHQSWTSAFPSQSEIFTLSGSDKLYLLNALSYTANLNSCLHLLDQGGSIYFAQSNWPKSWVKEIREQHITAIFMVPANYRLLARALPEPLPKVRSLVSAGAKIDQTTVQQLLAKFPQANFYEYYGASELGHVTYHTQEDLFKFPESVGKPFPGVDLWLEEGKIFVASPYLAPAYAPQTSIGDLGQLNEEGYLFLTGRENGLINKAGVKIVPEKVEQVLQEYPGILEVLVKGEPCSLKGQRVGAWVVPEKNTRLSVPDIRSYCQQRLTRHEVPDSIYFVQEIPRNANGKIIRR